ncbi:MAG: hypothetical protein AAGJ50_10250, partial [Pseudomonadota bacterium]
MNELQTQSGDIIQAAPTTGSVPSRRAWWQVWKRKAKPPKRALLLRLFGLSLWGAIKLTLVCILVGFVMLAMQLDP